jgi:hypothetical protein
MEKCVRPNTYTPIAINIAIHVVILFTILSVFFMMYVSKISTEALNGELKDAIDKGLDTLISNIPEDSREKVISYVKKLPLDGFKRYYTGVDPFVAMYNKWLFRTNIILIISMMLAVTMGVGLLIYSCQQCIDIKHIIKENIITFIFVGIIEYVFFTKVAIKYIPSLPSTIITSAINSLKNNIK